MHLSEPLQGELLAWVGWGQPLLGCVGVMCSTGRVGRRTDAAGQCGPGCGAALVTGSRCLNGRFAVHHQPCRPPASCWLQAVFNLTKGDLASLSFELQGGNNLGLPSKVGRGCMQGCAVPCRVASSAQLCQAALPPTCCSCPVHGTACPAHRPLPALAAQMYLLAEVKQESLRRYKTYDRILQLKQMSKVTLA